LYVRGRKKDKRLKQRRSGFEKLKRRKSNYGRRRRNGLRRKRMSD
jgi:hypothetical protein